MIPQSIKVFANKVYGLGGCAYLVGGWARDYLMNQENKDYDIEVHTVDQEVLKRMLFKYYKVDTVGESYTIWKVAMLDDSGSSIVVDVSLPRTEKKVGVGHRAFEVEGNPYIGTKEASRRRDFTVNAILYDILTGRIVDHFGGQEDIKNKVLRAVDLETFIEDSLRVLRAIQFAARFDFTIAPETFELCRNIDLNDLPSERLFGEVEKWLLSKYPSAGLKYFFELGICDKLFHREVFKNNNYEYAVEKVKVAMDEFAKWQYTFNQPEKEFKLAVQLSILAEIVDINHFFEKLSLFTLNGYNIRKKVLDVRSRNKFPVSANGVRRASTQYDIGIFFCQALALSRARNLDNDEVLYSIYELAESMNCLHKPISPLLKGQHIVDLGVPQGKRVGEIHKAIYELQLDGKVTTLEEAIDEARKIL